MRAEGGTPPGRQEDGSATGGEVENTDKMGLEKHMFMDRGTH